jgi:glycosyltransferase involved in cell wall biosynthesis
MGKRIAVIVPAYNEEHTIGDVVRAIRALGEGYDAVVINDNSTDKTFEMAVKARATVIQLPSNLGIGGAVQTGYKYALTNGYDACVQVDGDGQHPAHLIPSLLKPLFEDGYDIVIGSRFVEDTNYEISVMRGLGIRIISAFIRLATGLSVKDPTSGFRAINRKVLEFFSIQYPQDYPEPESLVFAYKRHFRVLEVPAEMKNRMFGISSITPTLAIYYMAKVLLAMFIDLFKKL